MRNLFRSFMLIILLLATFTAAINSVSANNNGNGYDYSMLRFYNVLAAHSLIDINDVDSTVAIADDGISSGMWMYLESNYDIEISYVYYDIADNSTHTTSDPNNGYVRTLVGHGDMIANLVAQIARPSNLYIIATNGDLCIDGNGNYLCNVEESPLEGGAVVTNPHTGNPMMNDRYPIIAQMLGDLFDGNGDPIIDILTMSWIIQATVLADAYYIDSGLQGAISALHELGVEIFAASGNSAESNSIEPTDAYYPCKDDVLIHCVGGIADDGLEIDINGNMFVNPYGGYHHQEDSHQTTSDYPMTAVYHDHVDFVASSYNVETKVGGGTSFRVVDGTSFSTPITAAIAALVWDAAVDEGVDPQSPNNRHIVSKVMKDTTERPTCPSGCSSINSYKFTRAVSNNYEVGDNLVSIGGLGYGTPDAHDAIKFIQNDLPTISLSYPIGGSFSGLFTVRVTTSDPVGIAYVKFFLDGVMIEQDSTSSYTVSINAALYPTGVHHIVVTVFGIYGDTDSSSTYVTFTTPPPPPMPGPWI